MLASTNKRVKAWIATFQFRPTIPREVSASSD
jgi:hypothetical protein